MTITRRRLGAALAASLAAPLAAPARATVPASASAADPAAAPPSAPSARLTALADSYDEARQRLDPVDATENGGNPRWEAAFEIDIAPAHLQRQEALAASVLRELGGIDARALSDQDQVTHALIAHEAHDTQANLAFPWHLLPVTHLDPMPVRMAQWASGAGSQPLRTTANYEHFLERLQGLPGWIDQAIVNMREGMARRITVPRALVQRTLPQLDALVPADVDASPYLAGVRAFPATVPDADRARLHAAYRAFVASSLAPSVARLRDFMRKDYLPAARTTAGFGALPDGARWYAQAARSQTTMSDLQPDDIHRVGLAEAARIRGELERLKSRFGDRRRLDVFLRTLESRPGMTPFRTDDEVLAAFRALNERVKAGLPRLFERMPKAPLEIRAVEPMRRDTASSYYVPPSLDGSRPGVFFAAYPDARTFRRCDLAALFLHEGQPGHHFQMAIQQEVAPNALRRTLWYPAHGEGWALYAEGLGDALGVYDDDDAKLGRLLMDQVRALRLVVDTGLHAQGWSRERAIAYLRAEQGTSEDDARRAVERYMAWPGQALAYKVGERKILALRDEARSRLGARFDIRNFHTQVLGAGALPLSLLQARVDHWVATQA